jgi:hypothetical protein
MSSLLILADSSVIATNNCMQLHLTMGYRDQPWIHSSQCLSGLPSYAITMLCLCLPKMETTIAIALQIMNGICQHLSHATCQIQIRLQITNVRPLGGNGMKKHQEPQISQMAPLRCVVQDDLKTQRIHTGPHGGEVGVSRMCT